MTPRAWSARRSRACRATSVVIATKSSVIRGGERWTPERVVASLDNSLRELGIDCIDVFQLHAVPPSGYDYVRDVDRAGAAEGEGAGKIPLPRHHRDVAERPGTPDAAARRARRDVGRGDGGVPSDEPEHARGGVPGDAAAPRRHAADVRGAQHLRPRRPRGRGDEGTGGAGQGAAVAGRRSRSTRLPDPSRRCDQPDRCGVSLCAARARRGCGAVRHRRSGASALEHRIDPAAAVAAGGPRPAEGAVQPSARRRPGVAAAPARRDAREQRHETRQDRGPALRRRLAHVLVPQAHHRRRAGRLVGIHRGRRQPRPDRRDPRRWPNR